VGLIKPAMMLSKVVLPQPEGPRTDNNSPCFSVKLTSLRACTVPPEVTLNTILRLSETRLVINHLEVCGLLEPKILIRIF
jgi:hypothetical protein